MAEVQARRAAAARKPWEHLRARDIMSHPVAVVRIDAPVREAAQIMARRGISGLAVLDRGRKAVGVISASDIVRYETTRRTIVLGEREYERFVNTAGQRMPRGFHIEHLDEEKVREVMTPRIVTIAADASLPQIARLMGKRRVHRTFVEENGRIVGIVTALDVARCVGRGPARV